MKIIIREEGLSDVLCSISQYLKDGLNSKSKIEKDTTKIANEILKKKNVKAGIKTKAIFMLMRMMQKANMMSGDADRAYWEEKGWLGKERPWANM